MPPTIYGEEIKGELLRIIVLVPGILGSQITIATPRPGRSDEIKMLWPPLSNAADSIAPIDQLVDTGSSAGLPGATRRQATILRPAYEELIQRLNTDGYTEQRGNLVFFGYDWTKSCRTNGTILADLIKRLARSTPANPQGTIKVDVICHSMGGIVTRSAIRLDSAPVRKTAYLASPHYGSPKAYFALHPSAPVPLASAWWQNLLINHLWNQYSSAVQPRGNLSEILRSLAIQFPSVYELLPDEFYFERHHIVDISWRLGSVAHVSTLPATYYDTANVCFPREGGMQYKVRDAMAFKAALQAQPPGDHISIWSSNHETKDSIVYSYTITDDNGFREPTDSGQRGDGTVPTDSAKVGAVTHRVTESHTGVPNSQETYDIVAAYLQLRGGQ
jgi:pimeloyl-ACP methyl ester carboxylesterase